MTEATPSAETAESRLTELFTAHHGRVVAYVARRSRPLGDLALAQDVAAEVFVLAWQRLSDPPDVTGLRPHAGIDLPWLLTSAGNILSHRARSDARRSAREERAMTDRAMRPRSTSTDPAEVLALSEQVARALDRMEPSDRELLLLRVWDELSFAEAARVLGCSPGAARVRWLRVRRRFADALTREDPDTPRARRDPASFEDSEDDSLRPTRTGRASAPTTRDADRAPLARSRSQVTEGESR